MNSFSRLTTTGPSKIFSERLLQAVQCTASDQSQIALRVLTKLVHISCRDEFPEFVAKALCSASLLALKKKGGICPIALGEILRRLIAKCSIKEAKLEAKEFFQSLQWGVGVKGGAEAIMHLTKLSYEKILTSSCSLGILQNYICNAFISIKRTKMLKAFASSYLALPLLPISVIHNTANYSMTNLLLAVKPVSNKARHWALCFV